MMSSVSCPQRFQCPVENTDDQSRILVHNVFSILLKAKKALETGRLFFYFFKFIPLNVNIYIIHC